MDKVLDLKYNLNLHLLQTHLERAMGLLTKGNKGIQTTLVIKKKKSLNQY